MESELEERINNKILELFGDEYFELDKQYQELTSESQSLTTDKRLDEIEIQHQEMLQEQQSTSVKREAIYRLQSNHIPSKATREHAKLMARYERQQKAKNTKYTLDSTFHLPDSIQLVKKISTSSSPATTSVDSHRSPKPLTSEYHHRREIKAMINPSISNRQIKKQLYKEKLQASKQRSNE